jgi:hypothetical protein
LEAILEAWVKVRVSKHSAEDKSIVESKDGSEDGLKADKNLNWNATLESKGFVFLIVSTMLFSCQTKRLFKEQHYHEKTFKILDCYRM